LPPRQSSAVSSGSFAFLSFASSTALRISAGVDGYKLSRYSYRLTILWL
jgi:hypothetical protein